MIDLYAMWIINGRGQVDWNDSAGLGSFIIKTLKEGDTHTMTYCRLSKKNILEIGHPSCVLGNKNGCLLKYINIIMAIEGLWV